jgi:hypothetical protein
VKDNQTELLTTSQATALQYVEDYAKNLRSIGQADLPNVLAMSNISEEQLEEAQRRIQKYARVGLHFHPDRIASNGETVVQNLIKQGTYKNQFETHLSNGKLDPVAGGMRAGWEDTIFGGAFGTNNAKLSERPKYGALNVVFPPFC